MEARIIIVSFAELTARESYFLCCLKELLIPSLVVLTSFLTAQSLVVVYVAGTGGLLMGIA